MINSEHGRESQKNSEIKQVQISAGECDNCDNTFCTYVPLFKSSVKCNDSYYTH